MLRRIYWIGGALLLAGVGFVLTEGPARSAPPRAMPARMNMPAQMNMPGGMAMLNNRMQMANFTGGFFRPSPMSFFHPHHRWWYNSMYGNMYGMSPYSMLYSSSMYMPYSMSYPMSYPSYSSPGMGGASDDIPPYVSPYAGQSGMNTSPAAAGQAGTAGHIVVKVPAEAEILFDGTKTTPTGPVRLFNTPPLQPGLQYVYGIRARWREDGREVSQTTDVAVSAGETVNVKFPLERQGK